MDKISVIIPVYKVEKYLRKCVDSVLAQTYTNLEIILVDDGSPDRCGEICDEYARIDSRIKVIHKENGGLSDARNAGIEAATGEYIAFVDSDDYISPYMYEKLYNAIIKADADMSICNFLYVDESGNEIYNNSNPPIKDELTNGIDVLSKKIIEEKSWYWIVTVTKLYKKSLFEKLRFPINKYHEDEFVFHKILLLCNKIACIPDILYYYVQRSNSIMNTGYSIHSLDACEAIFMRELELYELNFDIVPIYIMTTVSIKLVYLSLKGANYRIKENRKRYNEIYKLYCTLLKSLLKTSLSLRKKLFLCVNTGVMFLAPKIAAVIPMYKIFSNRRKCDILEKR